MERVPPKISEWQGPRRRASLAAICALAAATLILFLFDPRQYHFYPVCQFHAYTGLDCPGCGALRAAHQLLHGHLFEAFRFNALLVVSLPFVLGVGWKMASAWLANRPLDSVFSPKCLWLMLVISSLFGVLRNLPGFGWLHH